MSIFKVIKKTSPSTSEEIKISLKKFRQKDLKIDISNLNLIDATKTALMFSTKLFTQFPDKSVKWIVKDVETKIDYLENIKRLAKESSNAEEFKEKVKAKYSEYSGLNYLDMTAGYFFPQA